VKRAAVIIGLGIAAYYALILTNGRMNLWTPALAPGWTGWHRVLGFTFNSMLLHLLRGEFDVDPEAIQWEAVITGDGKTYAYFGIVPALVRLPLLPFFDLRTTDVSALTCLAAVILAAAAKLGALQAIATHVPDASARRPALVAVAVVIVLGGAQLQFLRVTVYQEAILWAGALAAVFVAVSVRGLVVRRPFSTRRLAALAILAGLAVLTRVSTGVGLCVATLALVACATARDAGAARARLARALVPLAALALLAVLAGVVNYARFGDALTFHAPAWQTLTHPHGIPALAHYGPFDVRRLPYGVMYYFAPVWFVPGPDGVAPFAAFRERAIDLVELPPSSFLLSDPLLVLLAAMGGALLLGRGPVAWDRPAARTLALGFAVPPVLILTAFVMAFRYRMEFYPLLEFLAFVALAFSPRLARAGGSPAWRRTLGALMVVSVVMSHAVVLLYKTSVLGSVPPGEVVGLYRTYLWNAVAKFLP
jgi:hypothetical protein